MLPPKSQEKMDLIFLKVLLGDIYDFRGDKSLSHKVEQYNLLIDPNCAESEHKNNSSNILGTHPKP